MTPTPLQRNEKVLDSFCKENEGKVLWATNSVLKNKLKELFDSVLATQRQEVLARVVENGDIVTLNKEGNCHLCGRKVGVTYWPTPPETSSWEEEFEIFTQDYEDIFNQYVCCNGGIKGDVDCACNGLEWKDKIKDFIRSVASSEYKRGVEDVRKALMHKIPTHPAGYTEERMWKPSDVHAVIEKLKNNP